MDAYPFNQPPEDDPPDREKRPPLRIQLGPRGLGILLAVNILVIALLAWPLAKAEVDSPPASASPVRSPEPTTAPTLEPSQTSPPPSPSPTASETAAVLTVSQFSDNPLNRGTLILSLSEGGYSHLFAFQPLNTPLTRLTDGPWEDITPAAFPDQSKLVFSSNRGGQWDLYLFDLNSGEITPLTDTVAYEGAPSPSPDGQYVAYESYTEGNLEVSILSVKGDMEPINLSAHPGADYSPAWSPGGRQIAFVSTRSGDPEIWLADLDKGEQDRFTNVSQRPESIDSHPVWSPDGGSLAWGTIQDGIHSLDVWSSDGVVQYSGPGDWPAWSPDGSTLLAGLSNPNQDLITAQTLQNALVVLPPRVLPGNVEGLAWIDHSLTNSWVDESQAAQITPTPLWIPELTLQADIPGGRHHLVSLEDVEAPYPQLHDLVDESFQALRQRVSQEAGWDLLASLENAYVPLTAPLAPGLGNDWLYTGRAFALNPLPINAGWMLVVPEQYQAYTYWRVYLKTRFQDGSQGRPLHAFPWDFNARYNGDQNTYESGGISLDSIPFGYWIDFTDLASAYGWERLAALPNWQSSFPSVRFNEFVLSDGQNWRSAMLELYPVEALVTPTVFIPPTRTPTPMPRWYRTPTPTNTPTPVPTFTPVYPTPAP